MSKKIKSCRGVSPYALLSLDQAARLIKKGGVVAYPTETFYGLGADPKNKKALGRIYRIKGREKGKPVSIIISSLKELQNWVEQPGSSLRKLIKSVWPGRVTFIFKAKKNVNSILTAKTGTIGIRIPPHLKARQLAQKVGGAITATSANLSGLPSCFSAKEVWGQMGDKIDGIVRGRSCKPSKGSTIVDVSHIAVGAPLQPEAGPPLEDAAPLLIRQGDVPFKALVPTLQRGNV
ncbi:MAG: threonylcarbamoyl-AMP synthase [Deltaproteobacteria bacterium GWA2_45_12]|nr:MAG: threonylcarbamoyl-AMP synthase [Deltaproteobacteria bacterium GWA2_45_12]